MTSNDKELVEAMAVAFMAKPEPITCEPGGCEDCDSWRDLAVIAINVARPLIEREAQEKLLGEMRERLEDDDWLSYRYEAEIFINAFAKSKGLTISGMEG